MDIHPNPDRSAPPRGLPLYFSVMVISLYALQSASLTLLDKLWILTLGLALPFALATFLPVQSRLEEEESPGQSWLPPILWLAAFVIACFLRFGRLVSLSAWPRVDEALNGFIGIDLSQNWTGPLFQLPAQMPPFYQWYLALLTRFMTPGLPWLWLGSALLSLTAFILFSVAFSKILRRRESMTAGFLMAAGFWPCFIGRFSHPPVLLLVWEALALLLIAWEPPSKPRPLAVRSVLFGLVLGSGMYVYFSWPVVALVAWILWHHSLKGHSQRLKYSLGLPAFTAALLVLPLIAEALKNGYGTYLTQLLLTGAREKDVFPWLEILSYPLSIWTSPPHLGDYGPVGGGFLNPITGAAALCGLLPLFRKEGVWARAASGVLAVFLLPGLLTRTVEFFRITQVAPLVIALAAVGLGSVSRSLPRPFQMLFLVAALAFSSIHDGKRILIEYRTQWATPSPLWLSNIKSVEQFKAREAMETYLKLAGDGRFFLFLHPECADPSLYVATYEQNLLTPLTRPASEKPPWSAVVCNAHLLPFLQKRFPHMTWNEMSEGLKRADGGLILAVLPEGSLEGGALAQWIEAEKASQDSLRAFLRRRTGTTYAEVIRDLLGRYPVFRGDPFLESCFWEKIYYLYLQESAFGKGPKEENLRLALEALIQAREKGYPAAHYFNEEGALWMHFGKVQAARKAFIQAGLCPINRTPSEENLRTLSGKTNNPIPSPTPP